MEVVLCFLTFGIIRTHKKTLYKLIQARCGDANGLNLLSATSESLGSSKIFQVSLGEIYELRFEGYQNA